MDMGRAYQSGAGRLKNSSRDDSADAPFKFQLDDYVDIYTNAYLQ